MKKMRLVNDAAGGRIALSKPCYRRIARGRLQYDRIMTALKLQNVWNS